MVRTNRNEIYDMEAIIRVIYEIPEMLAFEERRVIGRYRLGQDPTMCLATGS